MVPTEYKFIGENQPVEFSWIDGNLDDDGNLGYYHQEPEMKMVIKSIYFKLHSHEYYPLNLYVIFYQKSR